jgi:calcineurin-like phosphoesterase family protein
MTIYFTSDTHFFHQNILKYSKRPFQTIEEMNEKLIENWNVTVTNQDYVYFLGDFSFAKDQNESVKILNKLNGREVHLIMGNHDAHMKKWVKNKFTSISFYKEIYVPDNTSPTGEKLLILCHYAFRVFNKSHHGAIQLFGHSHGSLTCNSQQLDVGVDCWGYKPVSFEQIREKLKTLPKFESSDHHQNKKENYNL